MTKPAAEVAREFAVLLNQNGFLRDHCIEDVAQFAAALITTVDTKAREDERGAVDVLVFEKIQVFEALHKSATDQESRDGLAAKYLAATEIRGAIRARGSVS